MAGKDSPDSYENFRKLASGAGVADPTTYDAFRNAANNPVVTDLTEGARSNYDHFRDAAAKNLAAQAGLVEDAGQTFQRWRDEHPLLQWTMTPGALQSVVDPGGAMVSSTVAGLLAPSKDKTRSPLSFEHDQPVTSPGGSFRRPEGPDVSALPDAPASLRPRMTAGMGPGGDVYGDMGTERGILNAQNDQIADQAGFQEKKGEEAAAHLGVMNTQADMQHELAQAQAAHAQAYRAAVDEAEKEQVDAETKWQQASDEAASRGVDPGRYLRNRDAGFWINMMVGSIASGVLSAMNNQQGNPFMDSVRATMREDINSQEKNIDQGWKRAHGLETAYERARQRGADRVTATIRQYDKTLESLQTDIQARLTKAQIPEVKANLESGLQAIQQEREAMRVKQQEYWKAVRDSKARAAAAAVQAQLNAMRQARLDAQEWEMKKSQIAKNYAEADKTAKEPDDKTAGRFVALGVNPQGAQTGGLVADPEARKEIEKAALAHEATKRAIAEIRRLRGTGPEGAFKRFGTTQSPVVTPSWKTAVQSEANQLKISVNQGSGLGAYDNGTKELLEGIIPDLTGVGTKADDALEQLQVQADRKFEEYLNSKGLTPAVRRQDPNTGRWTVQETTGAPRAPAGADLSSIPGWRPLR